MATDRYYDGHGPISLRKLRKALSDLDTIHQPSVGAGAGFRQTPAGLQISNERPQEFWAMIDGVMSAGADQLNGAISSTSATTLTVDSAASFPSAGRYAILIDSEIMIVVGGQGTTTWTVLRGKNGTTAATHLDNAPVTLARRGYSWTKQGDEVGCFEDDNISSTTNQTPAYESSGRTDVPTGTIVKLRLGVGGEHYTFTYIPSSAAGTDYSCLLKSIDATNTVSSGGGTLTIAWDDETWDTHTYHDNSTNPSRISFTTATAGKYAIWFNIRLEASPGTVTVGVVPRAAVLLNGSDGLCNVIGVPEDLGLGGVNYHLAWYGEYSFVNGDYIAITLTNNTVDTLTVAEANYYTPRFGVRKVDKAG